jgi:hypothetical protein
LCYTYQVDQNRQIWQIWARILHRWGVQDLVAALLEAIGPLNLIGAQAVYIGQPFLNALVPEGHLEALADVLEDPEKTQAFTSFLREESHQS